MFTELDEVQSTYFYEAYLRLAVFNIFWGGGLIERMAYSISWSRKGNLSERKGLIERWDKREFMVLMLSERVRKIVAEWLG